MDVRDRDVTGGCHFLPGAFDFRPSGYSGSGIATSKKNCQHTSGSVPASRVDELVVDSEIVDVPRVLAGVHARAGATFVAVLIP